MNRMKIRAGFTLVEILVSLGILGIVMVSTFNFINSSVAVSSSANSNNELIREGQIGQQVLAARFKEACHVFPGGTALTLAATGFERRNFFTSSFTWTVNTDPFVALILPPEDDRPATEYRFIAYYAIPRNEWTSVATLGNNPGADARNDPNTWLIVQYIKRFTSATTIACANKPAQTGFAAAITAGGSDILLDYVDIPVNRNELFQVNANSIDYDIRLEKTSAAGNVVRIGGPGSDSSLRGRVFPINLGL
jgi:prepilin-type N-terminal cleavage/methylation domain-containing protein